MVVDGRHPGYWKIVETLTCVLGHTMPPVMLGPRHGDEHWIDGQRPLGHSNALTFRILCGVLAAGKISAGEIRRHTAYMTPGTVERALDSMHCDGLIIRHGSTISLSPDLPVPYLDLVRELGTIVAKRDPRLALQGTPAVPRVVGFASAEDGAPPLFGTDVRLRNLMALAKHGPMYVNELKRYSGVSCAKTEDNDVAPFGRGDLVETWQTSDGVAVGLHRGHPLRIPLRNLLLKMEQKYSLPPHIVRQHPCPPEKKSWSGDKNVTFGTEIATRILLSIGVLGWTFEALCVSLCTGYDRVVVKKALRKLEDCKLLVGERSRRPGFNIRSLSIAPEFCAARELQTLLNAACDIWPSYKAGVLSALDHLPPRTKAHLQKRGLLNATPHAAQSKARNDVERRRECLRRYYSLSTQLMRNIPSHELNRLDSNLYRSIRSCWKSFSAFRKEAGLPAALTRMRSQPSDELRKWCIIRYVRLIDNLGFQPNSADLMRWDTCLYGCIRVQWGGFPQFCNDLRFSPARRQHSRMLTDDAKRALCLSEYREFAQRLGRSPTGRQIREQNFGLFRRILKFWGSLGAIRAEAKPSQQS